MQSQTSTRRKQVTAGVAAACASSLAAGVLVAGAETTANAAPTPAPKRVVLKERGIAYKCKALNSVVNQAIGGPQKFLINGKLAYKGKLRAGTVVRPKAQRITLVLPRKLTRKVRNQLGVKRVRGSAKANLQLRIKNAKNKRLKLKGLSSPWRKVPKNKKLPIPAKGKAGKFRIPKKAKRVTVFAPKRFMLNAHLRPPAVGVVKNTKIRCKGMGKPKKRRVGVLMK